MFQYVVGISYSLHGQIPILVHEGLIPHCKQWDVPCLDRWRGRIYREQLYVQCVELVFDLSVAIIPRLEVDGHTNRNHALAIIIEILHQHLTETVYLPLAILGKVARQETALLF